MPSKTPAKTQLRLRVFAGPNGSGKSTIVRTVQKSKQYSHPIDFGHYINADDITQALKKKGKFSFTSYRLPLSNERFIEFITSSGLLRGAVTLRRFTNAYSVSRNSLLLTSKDDAEMMGQAIARFLREEMLRLKRRFSFETVFSHDSNLDIMRRAKEAGYKVYLYFVSTVSPEINKYRVALRVANGGHDVAPDKVESRYYKSLDLMFDAAQIAYQAFFFDNSNSDRPFTLGAHFKLKGEEKEWDVIPDEDVPMWFEKYYTAKVKESASKSL